MEPESYLQGGAGSTQKKAASAPVLQHWAKHCEIYRTMNIIIFSGDEMGLGKTIQLIAFFASLSYTGTTSGRWTGLGPSLIVCPATVLRQWVTEFHTWWPPLRVAVLHSSGSHAGTPRNLIRAMNSTPGGVLVMSYAAVAAHAEQLAGLDWHYVVLDEGHKIRNPEAQVGEIILKDRYSM